MSDFEKEALEIEQSLDLKKDNVFDKTILIFSTILFTLLTVVVSFQVIIRTFNIPIQASWTVPISRFLFILGTYFGAAVASRNAEHIKMDIAINRIEQYNPKLSRIVELIGQIVIVVFCVIVAVGTFISATNNMDTAILGGTLTAGHLYAGMFVAFSIMFVYELINMLEMLNPEWSRWN